MAPSLDRSLNTTSHQQENLWCNTHVEVVDFSFDWAIDNFSMIASKNGERFKSSCFSADGFKNIKWRIVMYPKGCSEENTQYVSIFLELAASNRAEVPVLFTFSILDSSGQQTRAMKLDTVHKFSIFSVWGFRRYIKRSDLYNSDENLLHGDVFRIHCDVRVVAGLISTTGKRDRVCCKVSECSLSEDLGILLANQKFSDVVLVSCDGRQLPAHKNILGSRSAVFASMFEHEMRENVQNRVDITDITHDVLQEVLYFVYTGKFPERSKKVGDLLIAADKYGLDRLKELCEEHMSRNLSTDSVAEAYVLADLHNATQLKACALEFICDHKADFVKESCWVDLMVHHPNVASEISKAIASHASEPPLKKIKRS